MFALNILPLVNKLHALLFIHKHIQVNVFYFIGAFYATILIKVRKINRNINRRGVLLLYWGLFRCKEV